MRGFVKEIISDVTRAGAVRVGRLTPEEGTDAARKALRARRAKQKEAD